MWHVAHVQQKHGGCMEDCAVWTIFLLGIVQKHLKRTLRIILRNSIMSFVNMRNRHNSGKKLSHCGSFFCAQIFPMRKKLKRCNKRILLGDAWRISYGFAKWNLTFPMKIHFPTNYSINYCFTNSMKCAKKYEKSRKYSSIWYFSYFLSNCIHVSLNCIVAHS